VNTPQTPPRGPAFATVPGHDYAADRADDYGLTFTDVPPAARTFRPEQEAFAASRRQDGWSAANQRAFLEALAEGHGVDSAARRVGLSAASAYAFRRTAKGATFALGWRAAAIVAREAIAETLLVRALEGTVDTIVRGETVVTRHKYDSRLALALLARLDRQVESAPDPDAKAARLVAQEFDAFLDVVGRGEGSARAGLFLASRTDHLGDGAGDLQPLYALAAADRLVRTGVATAAEVDITDLDPAHRAEWTAEQWARAEAAGLVALAPPPPPPEPAKPAPAPQHSQHSDEDPPVWFDEETEEWRTRFPPRPDFDGEEEGQYGDECYERTLDDAELGCIEDKIALEVSELRGVETAERDRWFARLQAATFPPEDRTPIARNAEHAPGETVDPAKQPGSDHDQSAPPAPEAPAG
jgi:hypothetical protein